MTSLRSFLFRDDFSQSLLYGFENQEAPRASLFQRFLAEHSPAANPLEQSNIYELSKLHLSNCIGLITVKYKCSCRHSVEEEIEGAPLEAAIEASRAGTQRQPAI